MHTTATGCIPRKTQLKPGTQNCKLENRTSRLIGPRLPSNPGAKNLAAGKLAAEHTNPAQPATHP